MSPQVTSFVAHNERERLMLAFAETAYEQGYAQTHLDDVAHRAGIEQATMQAYWNSKVDCLFDTLDVAAQQAFSAVAEAFMSTPGDCPVAAHRALAQLFHHLAGQPALVHLAVIDFPSLGPRAHQRTNRYLEMFAEFLKPGFAAMSHPAPNAQLVSAMISGGVYEVIRDHAVRRRIPELPAALPAVSYVCISTFFGTAAAERIATMPAPDPTPRNSPW
jgi:AcrR family transcriptional regulator